MREAAIPVAIGLGSNIGNRLDHLLTALRELRSIIRVRGCSEVYESEAMYLEGQSPFLNAVCVGDTELSPRSLLGELKRIERRAGRRAGGPRYGPRELDLDLLLYGNRVVVEPDLRVPHPGLAERPFVLWPLAEIAGEWIHPEAGATISELAVGISGGELRRHDAPRWAAEIGETKGGQAR